MYITTKQAAEYLGVSPTFLEKARHFGTGPEYVRIGGRAIRYSVEALERYAQTDVVTPSKAVSP